MRTAGNFDGDVKGPQRWIAPSRRSHVVRAVSVGERNVLCPTSR
jgi:hypothetical protein